ncbi:MAG TPA: universal stress protein [Thermoanaerobaculia bacterium]
MTDVRRILVPVDFSDTSRDAARYAFGLARQLDAEVIATTVIDVLDLRIAMKNTGVREFETGEDQQRQVRAWIDAEFTKLTTECGCTVVHHVRHGMPEKELLAAIAELRPDLVVIGATGISGRKPLGSRTLEVINETDVPVLVVGRGNKS